MGSERSADDDGVAESLPWESAPSSPSALGAWGATIVVLATNPERAARGLRRAGSLRPAVTFAVVSLAVHVVVATSVMASVTYWSFATSLERFGARESVGRIVALSDAVHRIVLHLVGTPVLVIAAPALLALATRALGERVPLRDSARVIAYACGLLVVGAVPILGLVSLWLLPAFVDHWLGAHTPLSRARRVVVVASVALGLALVSMTLDDGYSRTLHDAVTDLALDALT